MWPVFAPGLGDIARAKGMTQVAKTRASAGDLYRAAHADGQSKASPPLLKVNQGSGLRGFMPMRCL